MGIDRIGKKGPPAPPLPERTSSGRVVESGRPFEVTTRSATPPPQPVVAAEAPRTTLERWRSTGDLDVVKYIDLKVTEATAHLAALPPQELEAIRSALRDRMMSDPTLAELVHTATGQFPKLSSDE